MPIDEDALDTVYEAVQADPAFVPLRGGGNRFVPGEGANPIAMIVGEAPGAQEAIKLRPFVGLSGALLRKLMTIGQLRADWRGRQTGLRVIPGCAEGLPPNCWLTNVLKYRPERNRTPTPAEIDAARPHLAAEWIAVGAPDILVPVGAVALQTLMPKGGYSITRVAGTAIMAWPRREQFGPEFINRRVLVVPMLHPSYLLRGGEKLINRAAQDWAFLAGVVGEHIHAATS